MIKRGIKNLLKKLLNRQTIEPTKDQNVSIGKNTEIKGFIDRTRAPNSTLIIGDGCLIYGNISLETDNAVVKIGDDVFIGDKTLIICSNSITIGSNILISTDCLIQDSDNHSFDYDIRKKDVADWKRNYHDWSTHPSFPITISHGAWIGAKVIILKGVTVGEKAIVGAGSVVTKNVNTLTVVAGNPAKFIKSLEDTYSKT